MKRLGTLAGGAMREVLLRLIRLYQLLFSSFFGRSCRFYPTCSSYAGASLKRFGVIKGGTLAFWRLLRCGPWTRGGYDPVPEKFPTLKRLDDRRKTSSDSPCGCAKHLQPHTSRPDQ